MRTFFLIAVAACGSTPLPCRGIACINPDALVFLDVRYADGGGVGAPQISVNGSPVQPVAASQESLPDGGTAACACQQVSVAPGVSVIDVSAGAATARITLDAGTLVTQCCGNVVETRIFDEQVTLQ